LATNIAFSDGLTWGGDVSQFPVNLTNGIVGNEKSTGFYTKGQASYCYYWKEKKNEIL
jgi:hypothetical protein